MNYTFSSGVKTPSYKIVIAKYKEDILWISKLNLSNIIIYDKSDDPIPGSIPRKNIGREAETFINYVIENYYNLPDYVIFLQGDPFGHIEDPSITKDNLQYLIDQTIQGGRLTKTIPFMARWYHYPKEPLAASYPPFKFPEYFRLLFGVEPPENRFFAAGCQYIVPRANIVHRPLKFYKKLYKMIIRNKIYDPTHAHEVEEPFNPKAMHGWVFERLMGYIMGEP